MSPGDYILIMTHSDKPRHTTKQKVNCWLKRSDETKHSRFCQVTRVFPSSAAKSSKPGQFTDFSALYFVLQKKKKEKAKNFRFQSNYLANQGKSIKLSNIEDNKEQ